MSTRLMYMHTLDDEPATFGVYGEAEYLWFASNGHAKRAAKLVPTLRQIRREQQRCIAFEWKEWSAKKPDVRGEPPSIKRYGYVLCEVPR